MISVSDVEKIAKLARLELSDSEKAQFAGQLDNILEYVNQLNALDTTGINPTAHALEVTNVFREDIVTPFDGMDEIINNAPEHEDNAFVVPKIL